MYEYIDSPILAQRSRIFSENKRMWGSALMLTSFVFGTKNRQLWKCQECNRHIKMNTENIRICWSTHYLFTFSPQTFSAILGEYTYAQCQLTNIKNLSKKVSLLHDLIFFFNIEYFLAFSNLLNLLNEFSKSIFKKFKILDYYMSFLLFP